VGNCARFGSWIAVVHNADSYSPFDDIDAASQGDPSEKRVTMFGMAFGFNRASEWNPERWR
jgi:hypothetical protein